MGWIKNGRGAEKSITRYLQSICLFKVAGWQKEGGFSPPSGAVLAKIQRIFPLKLF